MGDQAQVQSRDERRIMGFIKRLSNKIKQMRQDIIGAFIPCPICKKLDGLSTWEGERYLKCQYCGATYQKKQKFIKNRDT